MQSTSTAAAPPIISQKLELAPPKPAAEGHVETREVLPGEINDVILHLVSISGPCCHLEPADTDHESIWLFLKGRGTISTQDANRDIEGETIARAPLGWAWQMEVPAGEILHGLRIRTKLSAADRLELKKYPQNNAASLVKKFSDCPAYREAIKSPKTTSRTLLAENFVPRVALGTVETTGPDAVAAHRHPMLEQLFLGLQDNDITVTADTASARLGAFDILHIPLGSNHGAQVAEGKKLHYVWMDFFMTKEGQEWLQMHQPVSGNK